MQVRIEKSKLLNNKAIQITGSKSESNRALLLRALFSNINIENLSNSDDTSLMKEALATNNDLIDVHHAGTAMRFLTAYFAVQENREVILTGSSRMKERPIKILVDALRELGAEINYLENNGFPPLRIKGKQLNKSRAELKANVSSQYISALLLIAPVLENGLVLELKGTITSMPYIKMTLSLLSEIGIDTIFNKQIITVKPARHTISKTTIEIESDWSSASYFYSIVALSDVGTELHLKSYKTNSKQGDADLVHIYKAFGVETQYTKNGIQLRKTAHVLEEIGVNLDLSHAPDIAQTIAVTAFGLHLEANLTGLHTLKIKETDRLLALKKELGKLGADIEVTENSLKLKSSKRIEPNIAIATYNDHRMAMAFAPLALKTAITIKDSDVVSKSYPNFWQDLKSIGFNLK